MTLYDTAAYLEPVENPNTPDICQAFAGCSTKELGNKIRYGVELEDKTTLAFFVNGEEVNDKEWLTHYNETHPDSQITYPGQLMENALIDDGIISYGVGQDKAYTKNLVSYCYDSADGYLSREGITLRVRHEEHRDPITGTWIKKAPDTSTKFPINQGCTEARFEFESHGRFIVDDNSSEKFELSLLKIIEEQVAHRLQTENASAAMAWLYAFTAKVGFDFSDKREKTNINCKRTQPYAIMYTRRDINGDLVRDTQSGEPMLFKPANRLTEEEKQAGMTEKRIVFMLCLDVNRIWSPHLEGVKIKRDHEIEHEFQDKSCDFTPGSLQSSEGVTPEEVAAMDKRLKNLKADMMDQNGLAPSKLSGMSKNARADHYVSTTIGNNNMPDTLTVRGKTDNFIMCRVNDMVDLIKQSQIVRKAYMMEKVESRLASIKQNVTRERHRLLGLRVV